ncbi:TolC family outer membrane protein [Pseudomonas sp. Irchel s3h17]|uniref:TolC family outer membrane protein n=1 Tax=Pseudomonas sp. Irchel s3h17 TaxID=2009182 RepID=UPI001C443B5D|nr:TolC family outer membrane protein [Pseudomonas sp. Irchel s3h17]
MLLEGIIAQAHDSDLLQTYQQALLHDAQYAAAKANQRVGQEQWIQGRAWLLPQVSLDAQSHWMESDYQVAAGNIQQRRQNRSYGIQLIQPVFRWQNWVQFQQGGLQRALAQIHLQNAGQTLLLRVAQTYFEVLNATDVLEAIQDLRTADAEQLASARKNFELGNVSIADVHEAQASFDRTTAQLIKARSDLELARFALARITGQHPGTLRGLSDDLPLVSPQPAEIDAWIRAAQRYSLDVQAQELLLGIADTEVRIRKAEHLPSVDLVISQNMQQNPNANTEHADISSIGLRLSMPLYSGGRIGSAAREALALHEQTEFELEDARRAAALAAREAWSGVMDGMAQVKALEAAKASARLAVASNQLGYKVGVRVGIDVLEVQSKFSDIVQQLSRARYDTLLAQLRLKAVVGVLNQDDIVEVNAMLND